MNSLENYILELLHINDYNSNNLIDINCKRDNSILLSSDFGPTYAHILRIIKDRIGLVGNTVLKDSSLTRSEQMIGKDLNLFNWSFSDSLKDKVYLNNFISNVYKNITIKGFNPLFLSIGILRWKIKVNDELRLIESPLFIFPVKLVRSGPVYIEFIDDDIYFNPCLYYKLLKEIPRDVVINLPGPEGKLIDLTSPINLDYITLEYLDTLEEYIRENNNSEETVFEIIKDRVYISTYDHEDICMYYDLRRNMPLLTRHDIIRQMYMQDNSVEIKKNNKGGSIFPYILPYDSTQEDIINNVELGNSMIIKGPPGTGKTLTIANLIAVLLANGKKVLFSSKKISAMTEVYAKLPKEIRDFCLLLEAESEAEASKINPSIIRKELKKHYDLKCEYVRHNNSRDIDIVKEDIVKSMKNLNTYFSFIFDNDLVEENYYDTILNYYKYDEFELVSVLNLDECNTLDKKNFNHISNYIDELKTIYKNLTNDFTHPVSLSPYYKLKATADRDYVYENFHLIRENLIKIYDLFKDYNLPNLSLISLLWFIDSDASNLEKILSIDGIDKDELYNHILDYINNKDVKYTFSGNFTSKELLDFKAKLKNLEPLYSLIFDEIELINKNISTFDNDYLTKENTKSLNDLIDKINLNKDLYNKELSDANRVFKKDLTENEVKEILKSYDTLVQFKDKEPSFFSIFAKKAYNNLKGYSYLKDVSFKEIVNGVISHKKAYDIDLEIEKSKSFIERILRTSVNEEIISTIAILVKANFDIKDLVSLIKENYSFIAMIHEHVDSSNLKDMEEALSFRLKEEEFNSYMGKYLKDKDVKEEEYEAFSKELYGVYSAKITDSNLLASIIKDVNKNKDLLLKCFGNISLYISYLDDSFDYNPYIKNINRITFKECAIFIDEALNRNYLASYDKLLSIINDENIQKYTYLEEALAGFNNNLDYMIKDKFELSNILMKSIYNDLIHYKINTYKGNKNSIVLSLENDIKKFALNQNKLLELNIGMIEDRLMSTLDKDDPRLKGIQSERGNNNLRLLFKEEASMILALKKCFILSPSTASLLFKDKLYNDFDVVIVDEASQMLPELMLPILFRSKQVVIVGDEWQMPPISHFKIKDSNGQDLEILSKEESVLALALKAKCFMIRKLKCHYRSTTESLIKFSQERFYPYMQTFPSPVPRTDELGIFDLYIPDGLCENGENEKEALAVCELVFNHLDKYYEEAKNELSKSLCVVAFGEKQLKVILSLFNSNRKYFDIYKKLEGKYYDTMSKLFFFRTIEKVQGQEADTLILSLTYGKNKLGVINQSFGELNKSYGECIFNVAVTRAKSKIYVVHSITHLEITNPNIDFIKNYLYISESLSKDCKNQFIEGEGNSFIRNIGNYLVSLGIDEDRIVYDFGVTKGSIRIPIVILSKDYKKAILGIWAEKEITGNKYIDINSRYYNILVSRGWSFYNIFAHGWFYNNMGEKEKLKEYLMNHEVL